MAAGMVHTPSPAIRADATTGAEALASAGLKACQIARMIAPIPMSSVKYAPIKEGMPITAGMGISFT